MHTAIAVPGKASTILTHLFGRGSVADASRYVVERLPFHGERRHSLAAGPAMSPRRRAWIWLFSSTLSTIASLQTGRQRARQPRAACRRVGVICTGLNWRTR